MRSVTRRWAVMSSAPRKLRDGSTQTEWDERPAVELSIRRAARGLVALPTTVPIVTAFLGIAATSDRPRLDIAEYTVVFHCHPHSSAATNSQGSCHGKLSTGSRR